jgi:hypothetical protein
MASDISCDCATLAVKPKANKNIYFFIFNS